MRKRLAKQWSVIPGWAGVLLAVTLVWASGVAAQEPPTPEKAAAPAATGSPQAAPMKKKSAADRIQEAVVPPPGEACPPDPEEEARIERLKVEAVAQTWLGETAAAVDAATALAETHWDGRRSALLDAVTEEAGPWASRPSTVDPSVRAREPVPLLLPQGQCKAFASNDSAACNWKSDEPVLSQMCPGWLLYRKLGITEPAQCASDEMPAERKAMCKLFAGGGVEACNATSGIQSLQCRFVMQRMDEGMLHCEDGERAKDCLTQLLILGLRDGPKVCDDLAAVDGEGWKAGKKELLVEQCKAIYTGKADSCPADPIGALLFEGRHLVRGVLTGGKGGVSAWLAGASNVPATCVVDLTVRRAGATLVHRLATVSLPAHMPALAGHVTLPRDIDPIRDELSVGSMCVPTPAWPSRLAAAGESDAGP